MVLIALNYNLKALNVLNGGNIDMINPRSASSCGAAVGGVV